MKSKLPLAVLLLLLSPIYAFADHEVGHGGNPIGIDFEQAYFTALKNFQKLDPSDFSKLPTNLKNIVANETVVATLDQLSVNVGSNSQICIATNDQNNTIRVNSQSWSALTNAHIKEGIALHEFLSLSKLEDSGKYPYSAKYLSLFNLGTGALGDSPLSAVPYVTVVYSDATSEAYFGWGSDVESAQQNAMINCESNPQEKFAHRCVSLPLYDQNGNKLVESGTRDCISISVARSIWRAVIFRKNDYSEEQGLFLSGEQLGDLLGLKSLDAFRTASVRTSSNCAIDVDAVGASIDFGQLFQ